MTTTTQFVFFLSTAQEQVGCAVIDEEGCVLGSSGYLPHLQPGQYTVKGGRLRLVQGGPAATPHHPDLTDRETLEWASLSKNARDSWFRENPY